MNRLIYEVLRSGVLVSIAVLLFALVVKAFSPSPFPAVPTPLASLLAEVIQLMPGGLLSLGVLLMILTPIARVLLTILVFAKEGDRLYVVVTGIVFLNLMAGVALGLLGVG